MASRTAKSKLLIAAAIAIVGMIGIAYVLYVNVLPDYSFIPMRFDSQKWKTSPSEFSLSSVRLRMADDFLKIQRPVGKTKSDIVELLGEPDDTPYFRDYDMVYHLGQERGWIAIDSEWLVLRLDANEIVTDARLVRD